MTQFTLLQSLFFFLFLCLLGCFCFFEFQVGEGFAVGALFAEGGVEGADESGSVGAVFEVDSEVPEGCVAEVIAEGHVGFGWGVGFDQLVQLAKPGCCGFCCFGAFFGLGWCFEGSGVEVAENCFGGDGAGDCLSAHFVADFAEGIDEGGHGCRDFDAGPADAGCGW